MKFCLFLVLIFFLTMMQISILPISFVLVLLIISGLNFSEAESLILAFFAGILWDLVWVKEFGLSPMVFVLGMGVILAYRKKILFSNPITCLLLGLVFYLLSVLALGFRPKLLEAIFLSTLVVVLNWKNEERVILSRPS